MNNGCEFTYSFQESDGLRVGISERPGEAYLLDGKQIQIVREPRLEGGKAPEIDLSSLQCDFRRPACLRLPNVLERALSLDKLKSNWSPQRLGEIIAPWIINGVLDRPTKPLLQLVGSPGSGKTSLGHALIRLLEGSHERMFARTKTPSDLQAVASHRRFLGLDNFESAPKPVQDILAAHATGADFGARRLYSDNSVFSSHITASVMVTSMDNPLNRTDLADRSIVIYLSRLEGGFVPQLQLDNVVEGHRHEFWRALLHDLNHMINLEGDASAEPMIFRMGDYAAIGRHYWGAEVDTVLDELLRMQASMALRDDEVIELLERIVKPGGPALVGRASEIQSALAKELGGGRLPKEAATAKGLGDHLRRMSVPARKHGLQIDTEFDRHYGTNKFTISRAG